METRPGKGVLIEEVSNHQETLALVGPGEVFFFFFFSLLVFFFF